MGVLNPKINIKGKSFPSVQKLCKDILKGDRFALSKAITLIESEHKDHKKLAKDLIGLCQNQNANTLRAGITGAPGVGKSTLLESLGLHILSQGYKPAILAIDPSSNLTGGSILGDKTRMLKLSTSPDAFIRPSPSGASLGGVAKKTRETVLLTEAAGFNPVFIETVGVGQSETAVHSMTDLFILLIQPGAGDEIQGIKRGIMEMADIIVINKADGNNMEKAKQTYAQYANAIKLSAKKESGWNTEIMMVSAVENTGIDKLWETILKYEKTIKDNGYYLANRKRQNIYWFEDYLYKNILAILENNPSVKSKYRELRKKVEEGLMSPYDAGDMLLQLLTENLK